MSTLAEVTRLVNGLYVVYVNGKRAFHGFTNDDLPPQYAECTVKIIYPYDDSIVIEVSAEGAIK